MHIGFAVYGGLEQTSGGYRYDRKLIDVLESSGDRVTIINIPQHTGARAHIQNWSPTVFRQLNRSYDVLVQDAWISPSVWRLNHRIHKPRATVGVVHLLRSTRASGSQSIKQFEATYLNSLDGAICTSADTEQRVLEMASLPTTVARPAGRIEGAARSTRYIRSRAHRDGPLQVCYIGNVVPRKGVSNLVRAVCSIQQPIALTIIGDTTCNSEYTETVRELIHANDAKQHIQLTGKVSQDELHSALNASHVLAVPAAYEGFGMVYLEAMEYGVVPIATTVGGANEMIAHRKNGFLVSPGDTAALAGHLAKLQEDRDRLATMAINAAAYAKEHPTWNESLTPVRSFFHEVLQ